MFVSIKCFQCDLQCERYESEVCKSPPIGRLIISLLELVPTVLLSGVKCLVGQSSQKKNIWPYESHPYVSSHSKKILYITKQSHILLTFAVVCLCEGLAHHLDIAIPLVSTPPTPPPLPLPQLRPLDINSTQPAAAIRLRRENSSAPAGEKKKRITSRLRNGWIRG